MNNRKTLEHYIDDHFQDTLKDIQKIVKIKTIKEESIVGAPFGLGLKKGLEETLKIAEVLGFKTVNLDNYIGFAEFGVGEEYIGVLGHIDVVPEGEHSNWSVSPFSGEIVGKNMISRGVLDNKGPIISALHSMKALKECVPSFNHRVRIIFGTNEESGDEDIKYYLSKEKAPKYAFTPDGQFPVVFSEKGIYTFSFKDSFIKEKTSVLDIVGGTRSNVVPEEAKVFLKKDLSEKIFKELENFKDTSCKFEVLEKKNYLEVISKGIPAHASSPERGINPITWLFRFLNKVISEEDSLKRFINFMDKVVGVETDGSGLNIKTKNEETGDLTLSCGIIKIIEEKNSSIYVKFNIRYPITTNEKQLDTTLNKIGKDSDIGATRFIMKSYDMLKVA
ncbi:MAG: Sapep family Mn(2+)-dependent dipeptidase [Fusobacteriaceae bacterium]